MKKWIFSNMLLVLWMCLRVSQPVEGLLVPASFSYDHKSSYEGNMTLSRVLEVVSQYEVDSHMEVILVGQSFEKGTALMSRLESLAKISAFSSPLSHVHEKIIYHVSTDSGLEEKVEQLLVSSSSSSSSGGKVDPNSVGELLEEYHSKASTATSLFVLDIDLRNDGGGNIRYSYQSGSPAGECARRAFIGQEAFAWVDLGADGGDIVPGIRSSGQLIGEVLPPMIGKFKLTAQKEKTTILASIIHRSAEGFYQFPAHLPVSSVERSKDGVSAATSQYYSRRVSALQNSVHHSFPPNTLDVAIITICLPGAADNGACEADSATQSELRTLSDTYRSHSLRIRSDVLAYDMASESQLAHAYYSSQERVEGDSDGGARGGGDVSIIDSRQLLRWLSSSALIQEVVENYGKHETELGHEYLPIFVFKGGAQESLFLDEEGSTTKQMKFPEPPGGALNTYTYARGRPGSSEGSSTAHSTQSKDHVQGYAQRARERERLRGSWPAKVVLAVRSGGSAAIDEEPLLCETSGGAAIRSRNGNSPITRVPPASGEATLTRARREVRIRVLEAVWGIPPPYMHYSGASRSMVRDYLWYTPPSLAPPAPTEQDTDAWVGGRGRGRVDGELSFLDKRVVSRHAFINKAEGILRHLTSLLMAAQATEPPVDIHHLLDLRDDEDDRGASSSADKTKIQSKGRKAGTAFDASSSSGSDMRRGRGRDTKGVKGAAFAPDSIFSEFLRLMDRAANDFSHLDFDSAMVNLGNALLHVEQMEARLEAITLRRSATVFCERGVRGGTDGDDAEQAPDEGGGSGADSRQGLLGWALLAGAVFLGASAGDAVKVRLRRRKRRGLL